MLYSFCRLGFVLIFSIISYNLYSQELIRYDNENRNAKILYNRFLYGVHRKLYNNELDMKIPDYPKTGSYSPTGYSIQNVKTGTGVCNYIYIPTKSILKPGQQYHLTITVKLPEYYNRMPYYRKFFGIALSSDLFENEWGLWGKHFIPLNVQTGGELETVELEFRPLCTSKYILLGVFQGPEMDDSFDFARLYNFELYYLTIENSKNPNNEFYYICDGFIEKKMKKWDASYDTDTIFFDSGSADIKDEYYTILDSIPKKLRTVQDLVSLYAYTDKKGKDKDNENLGALRNAAVRKALIERGLDSSRIIMTNYGESKSSDVISQINRKVEIDVNLGKLYQKYYTEALIATKNDNFGKTNKMINTWLHLVPPDRAIYALFDCWGKGNKSELFRQDLFIKIRSKFYKAENLKFILDSLYCENLKGEGLAWYLSMNRLPSYNDNCSFNTGLQRTEHLIQQAEKIYSEYGFPTKKDVGKRANQVLPSIVLQSEDLNYLKKYLSIFLDACEKQRISWYYYAKLYDKISAKLTGFQRYGTLKIVDKRNKTSFLNPIEDINKLREYRKQMKLAPLPDEVINETKKNQEKLDTSLVNILNTIYQTDQVYRLQTKIIEQKYGRESIELKEHWNLIHKTDSINLLKVSEILDQRGWLGPKIVGRQGNNTLLLVIQHSDLKTQLKYLQMIREAVAHGAANSSQLALLEDRIAMKQGKRQIYGSQIKRDSVTGKYYVYPIIEPEKVNERRAKVGLDPIEKYLSHWGIILDVEKPKATK